MNSKMVDSSLAGELIKKDREQPGPRGCFYYLHG